MAQFLMLDIQDNKGSKQDNFIDSNLRLVNQRYIDELITAHTQQEQDDNRFTKGKMDLENILNVN